jgi:hypothetical protein
MTTAITQHPPKTNNPGGAATAEAICAATLPLLKSKRFVECNRSSNADLVCGHSPLEEICEFLYIL